MKNIFYAIKKEAVLCIAAFAAAATAFAVPPDTEYLSYIDMRVLCLLFTLMLIVSGVRGCGLFELLSEKLSAKCTDVRLLVLALTALSFFVSMLVTNDVSLIVFVPFAITALKSADAQKYTVRTVVLQTIAANLGSMATPVGNPQNLFIYGFYGLRAGDFFSIVLPICTVSFVFLIIIALCQKKRRVRVDPRAKTRVRSPRTLAALAVLFAVTLLSVFGLLHYAVPTVLTTAFALVFNRALLKQADYALLLTFVCFFVFSGNIGRISQISAVLTGLLAKSTLFCSVLASQAVSNVPAAVLLSSFTENWRDLLAGVNIGGLGTPIASLASLISLKLYARSEGAKTDRYLVVFTVFNVLGLAILLLFYTLFSRTI